MIVELVPIMTPASGSHDEVSKGIRFKICMKVNRIYSIVRIEWNKIKQSSNIEQSMKLDGTHELENTTFMKLNAN